VRDPAQYARFSDERSRPFFNLLDRVPQRPFHRIVDLGCGTGELTVALSDRWPEAKVTGLDSSPQMLAKAAAFARPGKLDFLDGDINAYVEPADLIFSNAALQWVDGHESLFPRLASLVEPGGVFAVQMPHSFDQPSHLILEELARSEPWAERLASWGRLKVKPVTWYQQVLMQQGFEVDAWETTYYFVLHGEDPVLEWVKGSSLQPILTLLGPEDSRQFTAAYAQGLRHAYPADDGRTVYPFKRIFFVASRPES
jgi:trans-aconitate 2-methyltransferase